MFCRRRRGWLGKMIGPAFAGLVMYWAALLLRASVTPRESRSEKRLRKSNHG